MAKRSVGSYLLRVFSLCKNIPETEGRNTQKNLQLPRRFFHFRFQLVEQRHFSRGLCLGLLLTIGWFTQRLWFAVWRLRSEIYVKCIIDISTAELPSSRMCEDGSYVEKYSLMLWICTRAKIYMSMSFLNIIIFICICIGIFN